MSNDPTKPRWPGQQPTSFDPMTGQPLYGDPQQPPQQQWQQPQQPPQQQWQQPQGQWQQPPQPQQPQQQPWQQQQPPQQQWQQPPQQPWQQPQQQPWQQQQPPQQFGGYPQQQQQPYGQQGYSPQGYAQNMSYPQQPQGRADSDADDDDDDDESSSSLRGQANATVNQSDRLRFVRLTYLHLFGAILAFAGLMWCFMNVGFLVKNVSAPFVKFAIFGGRWNWGIVLVAFMAVSWVADYWASHTTSKPMQYVGLGLYVVAESIIFVPLLAIVQIRTAEIIAKGGGHPNIIRDSAIVTLAIFAALTASVYVTKKDFSFLRSGLMMASAAALALIFMAIGFGFNLGIVFSVAMVLLASGYVLYQTSQVFAHYHTESYVAAALALFSSVALMFWYVIRIFMRMRE